MYLKSILILENNLEMRTILQHTFESRGYMTWTCPMIELAPSLFEAAQPAVVILDLDIESIDCIHLIDEWHARSPQAKIVVESGDGNMERIKLALDHGAHAFLAKPYSLAPLFELIETEIPPDGGIKQPRRAA